MTLCPRQSSFCVDYVVFWFRVGDVMDFENRIKELCASATQCCSEDKAIELTREWKELLQQMVEQRRLSACVASSKSQAEAA